MTTLFKAIVRRYSDKTRVWAFLACLLLLGLGTGSTLAQLINRGAVESTAAAYERQVSRLADDLEVERGENRKTLTALVAKVDALAAQLAKTADTAENAAGTAESAALTAKSAATTARGAAKNAAKAAADSQIRIREVKPRTGMKVKP